MKLTNFLTAAALCSAAVLGVIIAAAAVHGAPASGSPVAGKPGRTPSEIPPGIRKAGWRLTFHDEFNEPKLNRSKWSDSYPDEVRTHGPELEYYAPAGVSQDRGSLRLTAVPHAVDGKTYTSGMVSSYGRFSQRYGLFEIRARFPRGKGMWPAFWLLPDNKQWPPEIDVLEILGHEPSKVYMTNHWRDENGRHQSHGTSWVGPDFSKGYHTFAVDWEPGSIVWYVDGVQRARSTEGVPEMPMYVIANLAVGGDWPGSPDASTRFPASMDVDYIRVYAQRRTRTLAKIPYRNPASAGATPVRCWRASRDCSTIR